MKKAIGLMVVAVFLGGTFLASDACAALTKGNLYDEFSKRTVTKVYVVDINNSSNNDEADMVGLKKQLGEMLSARKSVAFEMVKSEKDADIVIKTDVNEFLWTDEDPVDMITGIGPVLMDATIKENYARMKADFEVLDAKTGKMLWEDSEKATITDKTMTKEDSVDMLNERIVDVFIRECFGKGGAKK